jgi:hypothetical protein
MTDNPSGDVERDEYFIDERDDDMLIARRHWQFGSQCIARRPKLLTNEQWRPEAERIVAALSPRPASPDQGDVERVARAIYRADYERSGKAAKDNWPSPEAVNKSSALWEPYLRHARAAIAALSPPTRVRQGKGGAAGNGLRDDAPFANGA